VTLARAGTSAGTTPTVRQTRRRRLLERARQLSGTRLRFFTVAMLALDVTVELLLRLERRTALAAHRPVPRLLLFHDGLLAVSDVSIAVVHAGAGWADRFVAVRGDGLSKGHSPRTAP
jgi:hypothetical protein